MRLANRNLRIAWVLLKRNQAVYQRQPERLEARMH